MKRLIEIAFMMTVAVLLCSCQGKTGGKYSSDLVTNPKSAENPTDKMPIIEFEKTEYDFGKIVEGEVVSYTFHFTNVGNIPLIITNVEKSCGCTASDYPREPIAPGERGDIKITYDSKGHHGFQSKTVVVNANTMPSKTTLRIKAEI